MNPHEVTRHSLPYSTIVWNNTGALTIKHSVSISAARQHICKQSFWCIVDRSFSIVESNLSPADATSVNLQHLSRE